MSTTGDIPELEPLEEVAAPAPPVHAASGVTPVSLGGLPAPVFGMRAQKEYYRFFFAGLLMFMGCLMPWGPEWDMAGWKTLKGGIFTVIALGVMWSSWVAIAHGRFDLSSMRWLFLAGIPLLFMVWHVVTIFDAPAVEHYLTVQQAQFERLRSSGYNEPWHVTDWSKFFRNLGGIRTPEYRESLSEFIRAAGSGQFMLLFGSLLAELFLIKGIATGIKTGASQKKAAGAGPKPDAKKGKRR